MEVQHPLKSIHTDTNPVSQPQGTYRYGFGLVNETKTGDREFKTNELSTQFLANALPSGRRLLGSIYMTGNRRAVFSFDGETSHIGILDANRIYIDVVSTDCLNFGVCLAVDGIYRSRRDCEDVIYYTDGFNPIRYFNFSAVDQFKDDNGNWDCSKFNLFRGYTIPCFSAFEVLSNGDLRSGSYRFAIQYLDEDLNPTNYIRLSSFIDVFDGSGSSNVNTDALGGGGVANRSIKVTLDNLDQSFPFYRYAVVSHTSFTGRDTDVYVSDTISTRQPEFIFTGNLTGFTLISLEEVLIGKIDIESANHITQLENRLILAETRGKQVNQCDFQRFASKIKPELVVETIPIENGTLEGNNLSGTTRFAKLGYMGDEVYAFGIQYVFNDGTLSRVFHIPGNSATGNDKTIVAAWSSDIAHLRADETAYNANPDLETWEAFNTGSVSKMAYYESKVGTYAERDSCNGQDYWGVDWRGNALVDKPVRHHRFPSRTAIPHYTISSTQDNIFKVFIRVVLTGDLNHDLTINGSFVFQGGTVNFSTTVEEPLSAGSYDIEVFTSPSNSTISDFDTSNISGITITNDIDSVASVSLMFAALANDANTSTTGTKNLLSIKFSNIELPHPDIVGYFIVRAKRDELNRTVLDKGISSHLRRSDSTISQEYSTFSYFGNDYDAGGVSGQNDDDNVYTFTPRNLYANEQTDAAFIKREGVLENVQVVYSGRLEDGAGAFFQEIDTEIEVRTLKYGGLIGGVGESNHAVNKQIILDGTSYDDNYEQGNRLYNLSHSNKVGVATINSPYASQDEFDLNYISLKRNSDVYSNLNSIDYYSIHDCILSGDDSGTIYGGDTFITRFDLNNSLVRKVRKTPWNAILGAVAIVGSTIATIASAGALAPTLAAAVGVTTAVATASIITGAVIAGAIGVTASSVTALLKAYRDSNLDAMASDDRLESVVRNRDLIRNATWHLANEHLQDIYVESEINTELKQAYNYDGGAIFLGNNIDEYFRDKWMVFNEDEQKYESRGVMAPEIYHVNPDFYNKDCDQKYAALPAEYNCCSACLETHPNRVRVSEQSFQEELTDNYRTFLVNNYRDIDGHLGTITDVFVYYDNLHIRTTEGLWKLPHNYQERVSGEIISFIGNGEIFGIPEKPFNNSEINSMGGNQFDKYATLNHPYGVFLTNQATGEVFNLTNRGENISNRGERNFFKENLTISLLDDFRRTFGVEYNCSVYGEYGVGLISTYDARYDRILLTKKDYVPLLTIAIGVYQNTTYVNPSVTYYDYSANIWFIYDGANHVKVDMRDTNYFTNKSWTKSFSPIGDEGGWISYHPYVPDIYLNTPGYLCGYVTASGTWEHNVKGSWNNYYGTQYPTIIETILHRNQLDTKFWKNFIFQTVCRTADETVLKETFDQVHIYNENQSSGVLTLEYKGDSSANIMLDAINDTDLSITRLENREDNWTINELNDMTVDKSIPLFINQWQDLFDKTLNTNSIDFNKDWKQLERFRGKYLHVRLIFNNLNNDKELIIKYIIGSDQPSIR